MRAYFFRHGQTNFNLHRLCNHNPDVDVHLTELGIQQAQALIPFFRGKILDHVFISNLPRTRQTADIALAEAFHPPLTVEPRIFDRDTGFDGRSADDFWAALGSDVLNAKIDGHESFQDVKRRVHDFLTSFPRTEGEITAICVVTHNEIMKIITGYFQNLEDNETWSLQIPQCHVLEVEM